MLDPNHHVPLPEGDPLLPDTWRVGDKVVAVNRGPVLKIWQVSGVEYRGKYTSVSVRGADGRTRTFAPDAIRAATAEELASGDA